MAAPYPVTFDAEQPERYDRPQAALRLVILILLSLVGSVLGWLFGVVYLVVPVAAAILVQQAGASGYLARETDRVSGWLRWLVAVYAWLLFLTDRFPSGAEPGVSFGITPGGSPTTGSALLRLVTSIPSGVLLVLLGLVSGLAWIVELVTVLVYESVPRSLYGFQRGVVRWLARLLGYHASLVEEYPPFSLDTGREA